MGTMLIDNIGLLVTAEGRGPARGDAMGRVAAYRDASVLVKDGIIQEIHGHGRRPASLPADALHVNAGGRLATPGLIDAHTHLVFGGYRQHEAVCRVRGDDYMTILKAGGGILDTVSQTRREDFQTLFEKGLSFVREMLHHGVTTCEIKSGYGLDIETEAKQLRVARALGVRTPMQVKTTFLGAHAVPPEFTGRTDAYVDYLTCQAIPAIAKEGLADACDVFCEKGVFGIEQSRRILACAKNHGLAVKLHADEMASIGGGGLAAEMGAVSADHLIAVSEESLKKLSSSETVAVLLPQTSLYLDKPYAPAGRMMEMGIPVALATDFNPGSCPSNNLQLSMTLGFIKYKMSPEEVLTAVTKNAACALSLDEYTGTLEVGKQADMVLWNAEDLAMLCYRMGSNLAHTVIKRGVIVNV